MGKGQTVPVCAAHPDDEILGCVARFRDAGYTVQRVEGIPDPRRASLDELTAAASIITAAP
jgi:hypothetical protein